MRIPQDALYERAKTVVQFHLPRLNATQKQQVAQLLAGERDTLSFYVPANQLRRVMQTFRV